MNIIGIAVFSAEGCSGCETVKSVLSSRDISFLIKDINEESVQEQASQLGIRGIPVTLFCYDNGQDEMVVGSSQEALARIIEIIS